jgi:hypothetical protein
MLRAAAGNAHVGASGTVEAWDYSRAGADQNYWFRQISFDANGKVIYKDGHYFAD